MTFIIGTFQFHCESEHKQVKWSKTRENMWKADGILHYLQNSTLFKCLISWYGLYKKWMITVLEEKCTSFNFIPYLLKGIQTYLAQKNSRSGAKINTIFRLSWKYFNHVIIKTF